MKEEKTLEQSLLENINARSALIFLESVEEQESIRILQTQARGLGYNLVRACAGHFFEDLLPNDEPRVIEPTDDLRCFPDLFNCIREYPEEHGIIFLLQDVSAYMNERSEPEALAVLIRQFKSLKSYLRETRKTVVVLDSHWRLPQDLNDEFTHLKQPRPSRERIKNCIVEFGTAYPDRVTQGEDIHEHLIDAASGLTVEQTQESFAKAITSTGRLDENAISFVLDQKKEVIQRNGMIEFIDGGNSIDSVGGLDNLKSWLRKRKRAFISQGNESLNLPTPKGILVFGVPGGGKSLTAKAVQSMWEIPLLRFDMGKIFARYVGESENNLREVLRIIEAISPCVLWIDEMEKGFAGASGGHETTTRILGSFLTWMQEKTAKVFVIATANDITQIPTEFTRKGRFDDLFFVEPPNKEEREIIFQIQLQKQGVFEDLQDSVEPLVLQSQDYTGAEIENAIIEAKYNAFDEEKAVNKDHIINSLKRSKPVWSRFKKQIQDERFKEVIDESRPASTSEDKK